VISSTSDGTAPTAFALAAVAMLLTALSYAKMAKIFPNSGSAYVYARRLLDSRVGFLVGWAILLDYLFLPTVAWLFQSFYLAAQFPEIPVWAWLALNAGLTTIINVTGIVLTDRVNKTLTLLVVTLIGIFIAYCLAYLGETHPRRSRTPSGIVQPRSAVSLPRLLSPPTPSWDSMPSAHSVKKPKTPNATFPGRSS
jgi:amino acid transporter